MITARGLGLVIAAVVLFVLGGFTRVGWLLMFDAVLWGVLAVSAVMPRLALGRLSLQRRLLYDADLPGPMQDRPVHLELTLSNSGLLPCMFLTATYLGMDEALAPAEGGRRRLFLTWLGRKSSLTTSTAVVFRRRGVRSIPPLRVETRVPFGLFRRSRELGGAMEVLVLPKVHPLTGLGMLHRGGASDSSALQSREGEQVTGSRSYSPGDPWRHIHWRNTARTAGPQVKEFEKASEESLTIVLGVSSQGTDDEALEQAVEVAASIGDAACRAHGRVRLLSGHTEESLGRRGFLEALALFQGPEGAPQAYPALGPTSDVVAIARDTDEAAIAWLSAMARSGWKLTAILMRGFDYSNIPAAPGAVLADAGAMVIESWPDEVRSTLASLERAFSEGEEVERRATP